MIEVPYYKQEYWFSCLPACIRMLLEFYNIKVDEKTLRKLFKTTTEGGTSWQDVIDNIKEFNVDFVYLKNQDFDKLKELVRHKIPVVVSVDTRKLGDFKHRNHTVVVVDIDENHVIVYDPEKGPNVRLNTVEFIDAWKDRLNRIGYIVRK